MRDMKIRTKLLAGFGVVLLMTLVTGIVGIVGMNKIAQENGVLYQANYQSLFYMAQINKFYQQYRVNIRNTALKSSLGSMSDAADARVKSDKSMADLLAVMAEYGSTNLAASERTLYNHFSDILQNKYKPILDNALDKAVGGDYRAASELMDTAASGYVADLDNDINSLMDSDRADASNNAANNDRLALLLSWAAAGVLAAACLVGVVFALVLTKLIANPIKAFAEAANRLADGNLDVSASSDSKDETGDLGRSFGTVVDNLKTLLHDMGKMADEQEAGDIDFYVDAAKFRGGYGQVALGTNRMVKKLIDEMLMLIDRLNRVGAGDFDFEVPLMPGKKVVLTQCLEQLKANLKGINGEIDHLTKAALDGRLDYRSDAGKHKGGWGGLLNGLNNVMDAVGAPIDEISRILTEMSRGNLGARVSGTYKGDFQHMKDTANSTTETIASYISDISGALSRLANDDYNFEIRREFVGDFSQIKESLDTIINKLNSAMTEISLAAEQVSAGARQISESSMTLAEGASEQASTVEELTASIATINEQTRQNAENAKTADSLSLKSKTSAESGNEQMSRMLASMQAIKEASDNIAKIIKVIDDIALQTNLLALNAAVEAASAGQRGKGFAVVAAEVRTLSLKSKDAAKETSQMIEEAIARVREGTEIANSTSDALKEIVVNVSGVSELISSIAEASVSQAESVSQASIGLGQISDVVQKNSATSEESAAAAQELSSQSITLNNMLSVFKLKKIYAGR
ncbi:MAG: methyl-accepting chemotaxis protein [Firmicutes bacterium]|nr:methyl-accepting chemotaxis protein [Bacillota bacterium]